MRLMFTVIIGVEMFKPDFRVQLHDKFFQVIGHGCSPLFFSLPQRLWPACHGNSERLEERFLPRMAWIENSIKPEFHHVLDYHPNQVVGPNKTDNSPWKCRHEPALAAHQDCSDLGRDNGKEKLGVRIRRFSKNSSYASHE